MEHSLLPLMLLLLFPVPLSHLTSHYTQLYYSHSTYSHLHLSSPPVVLQNRTAYNYGNKTVKAEAISPVHVFNNRHIGESTPDGDGDDEGAQALTKSVNCNAANKNMYVCLNKNMKLLFLSMIFQQTW